MSFFFQLFDLTIEFNQVVVVSLPLLQQDGKQHDFHGEQAPGMADGGTMLKGRIKKFVQNKLVAETQSLIERLQFCDQVKGDLCGGGKGAAHKC